MFDISENDLPPNAAEAETDDCGCFEPFIPPVAVPTAPKAVPKPEPGLLSRLVYETLREIGVVLPTPTDTPPDSERPAPAAAVATGDAETDLSSEIPGPPVEAKLLPPRVATATELFTWIKRVLRRRHLFIAKTPFAAEIALLVTVKNRSGLAGRGLGRRTFPAFFPGKAT